MNIAFVTEMSFIGKIPRDHKNMRTEFAWFSSLNAVHLPIFSDWPDTKWDLIILIIPKTNIENVKKIDWIKRLKHYGNKTAIMQEGSSWYFQDYKVDEQVWYYNILANVDRIYVHNMSDKIYYSGLINHLDIRILPTLMLDEPIEKEKLTPIEKRNGIIIGGNFTSWYSGFDSYIVAREIEKNVFAPSMGRRQPLEENLIKHLPYMIWNDWIIALSKFKYAVHLARRHLAGTFSLNCSYLSLPCIGYYGLDTQEKLHPNLTVDIGDLVTAKKLIKQLCNDKDFYNEQCKITKENYHRFYSEDKFIYNFWKDF